MKNIKYYFIYLTFSKNKFNFIFYSFKKGKIQFNAKT